MKIAELLAPALADLASARQKVAALSTTARKTALAEDSEPEAANDAMKAVRVLGKVDSAIKVAEGRINKATKPRVKKAKKATDQAAPAPAQKKK